MRLEEERERELMRLAEERQAERDRHQAEKERHEAREAEMDRRLAELQKAKDEALLRLGEKELENATQARELQSIKQPPRSEEEALEAAGDGYFMGYNPY